MFVPLDIISSWYGSYPPIPQLCDGGSDGKGGTVPDLRGRMIMGVSDAYKAGSTGGSANHSHSLSGTVGETTLTEAQMPKHTHTTPHANASTGSGGYVGGGSVTQINWPTGPTGSSQPHTHTLDGASGEANGLPPYYTLAYIMRCA